MRGVRLMRSHRRSDQRNGLRGATYRRSRASNQTPTARPLVHFSDPQRRWAAALDVARRSAPEKHEVPPWRRVARFILTAGGASGRRRARFILMAGGASAASVFLIDFIAQFARRYSWTLEAPGPVALFLGTALGITLTRLYTRDFEPLDPTLTRRLTIYGVLTATTTLVVWRLMLRIPYSTDLVGLLLGSLLGLILSWVCDRHLRNQ